MVEAGGVPSAIRDSKNRLIMAFQWFPQEEENGKYFDKVAVIISEDNGKTWSKPKQTNLPGGDPTIVQSNEGEYMIIYVAKSNATNQKPPASFQSQPPGQP